MILPADHGDDDPADVRAANDRMDDPRETAFMWSAEARAFWLDADDRDAADVEFEEWAEENRERREAVENDFLWKRPSWAA